MIRIIPTAEYIDADDLVIESTFDAVTLDYMLYDARIVLDEKIKLKLFHKNKKDDNIYREKYNYSANAEKIGRVYSSGGLQGLKKRYRNALLGNNCMELDFENAHYRILLQIAQKYGMIHENIKNYVENRNELLQRRNENRKIAKEDYLKCQYGGRVEGLEPLSNECKNIIERMKSDDRLKYIYKHAEKQFKKKKNTHKSLDHSFLSHVLQTIENRCAMTLYGYVKDNNLAEIKVINHDAIIIKGGEDIDDETIKKIEEEIYENTDYYLKVTKKELLQKYIIEEEKDFESENKKRFIEMKNKWEEEYGLCKILDMACYSILVSGEKKYFKKEEMLTNYGNQKIKMFEKGKMVDKSFIKLWFEYEDIKVYDKIDCITHDRECPPSILNVWEKFPVIDFIEHGDYEYNEKAVEDFNYHLCEIICGGDVNCYGFMKKWIANMFKYPSSKSLCPIIVGEEGTGKDLFVDILAEIIGTEKRFITTRPEEDVWGKFNSIMERKMLVQLSEISCFNTAKGMNDLKDFVTNPTIVIKRKGINSSTINSNHKYIVCTNHAIPLKINDGNRRFVTMFSSSKMKGKNEYFKKLLDIKENINDLASIYDYYMKLENIPQRLTERDIVESEYQKEVKEISMDDNTRFMKDYIYNKGNDENEEIHIRDLYPHYLKWCQKNYINTDNKNIFSFSGKLVAWFKKYENNITKIGKDRVGAIYKFCWKTLYIEMYGNNPQEDL